MWKKQITIKKHIIQTELNGATAKVLFFIKIGEMYMNLFGDKIPKPKESVLWIRYWAFGDVFQAAADSQQFKTLFLDVI